MYATDIINMSLSVLFNTCILHRHLPRNVMHTVITPVINDNKGNVSSLAIYRSKVISCACVLIVVEVLVVVLKFPVGEEGTI